MFALARAGRIPLVQALEMAHNYVNETDYSVWFQLNENLRKVGALFADSPAKASFDKFILSLYDKISEIGWDPKEGEKDLNRMLRALVLSTLISHGHQASIDEAKRRYAPPQGIDSSSLLASSSSCRITTLSPATCRALSSSLQ